MSPDAVFGLLHLADRFSVMLRTLAREPLPELPAMQGRVIRAPEIPTPEQDAAARAAEAQAAAVWRALAGDCEGGRP